MWGILSSFNYNDEWKAVAEMLKTKPKTALSKIDKIRSQAEKENNVPQQLRCIVFRNELMRFSDIDEISKNKYDETDFINDLQAIRAKQTDAATIAVCKYLESRVYLNHYNSRQWLINQRTGINGYIPENLDEWTTNIYKDKIKQLRTEAISEPAIRKVKATEYEPLLELGADSRIYRPTLFDLLVNDAIDNNGNALDIYSQNEKLNFYNELANFHKDDEDKSAYVMARIGAIIIEGKNEKQQLQQLLDNYKNIPSSILIRIELANALIYSKDWMGNYTQKDVDEVNLAMQVCKEGIAQYPKHTNINLLKNIINQLEAPYTNIEIERNTLHGDKPISIRLKYANRTNIKLALYRYDADAKDWEWVDHDKLKRTKVGDYQFALNKTNYLLREDTTLELPSQPVGAFRLVLIDKNTNNSNKIDFVVSNLAVIKTNFDANQNLELFVVDNQSGAPCKDLSIDFYTHHWKNGATRIGTAKTDNDGFAKAKGGKGENYFNPMDGNDKYLWFNDWTNYGNRKERTDDNHKNVIILTDRSIYRPGQTVHFKCIAYAIDKQQHKTLASEDLHITIEDANHQVIEQKDLATNDFGSAASSFTLPNHGLSGFYTFHVNRKIVKQIQVEEYKRPSFEVQLKQPTNAYTFGDTITINGNVQYLMGTPVQEAKVRYTITKTSFERFWWISSDWVNEIVASDTISTDGEGAFVINFTPQTSDENERFFDYKIQVTVTDANGESQSNNMNVPVGTESMAIDIPNDITVSLFSRLPEIPFKVVNLRFEALEQAVDYSIYRGETLVANGKTTSHAEDGFRIKDDTKNWESGKYTFKFSATDDKGHTVRQEFKTILYRQEDKCPPIETYFWVDGDGTFDIKEGETRTIYVGSSHHDAHLLVLTYDENLNETHQWHTLNNEIKPFTFKLNSEHLQAKFFLLHDGVLERTSLTLNRRIDERVLPIKLSVFRDKMQPGSTEKWTLTLPAEKAAEVVATMYDASLDQFNSNSWEFPNLYVPNYKTRFWDMAYLYNDGSIYDYSHNYGDTHLNYHFDTWTDIISLLVKHPGKQKRSKAYALSADYTESIEEEVVAISEQNAPPPPPPALSDALSGEVMGFAKQCDSYDSEGNESYCVVTHNRKAGTNHIKPKVRSNFAETAFFYPQLNTDSDGNVNLSFTIPESLTRWKFMALGHTKDLFVGKLVKEVVTQKDFMVSPNFPRFLRSGDECVLTAKLVNLTDKAIDGQAKLELLDPVNETVVTETTTAYHLEANKNGVSEWQVKVPEQTEALLVRVSALSSSFADAEQKLLPVLSNKVVLTQTQPLVVRGGKTKDYVFDNLKKNNSKSLSNRFLKLEMATNPIWYAVQALPSVSNVEHENAISLSTAMFASEMAQQIANTNPKIFKVIELWKQQGGDKQTLLSNLERNTEVKNVLLNETPWVMDAKNETESKQRLATLFDVNNLRSSCATWRNKLNDLQTEDGGWAWFKGMRADRYTTLYVLDNYGRLKKAGINISAHDNEISDAISYLDYRLQEDYNWAKKHIKNFKKDTKIGTTLLYYFQVRSLFSNDVPDFCKEAYNFYYNLMTKQWADFSLQGKALAAIALQRGGNADVAKKIAESIRQFSVTTEENGMYWPKNVGSWCWEDAAIATHTRLMEALQLVDKQPSEQDELRIWLLNQKRTQNWDNIIATTDALNVLLNGNNWLGNDNQVTIRLGSKTVEPETKEAATGYYSLTIPGKEITPELGDVQLQSADGGNMSWGALYWQYEEKLDNVEKNKTGLHIEKAVMLESQDGNKTVLKTLNKKNTLNVGDKVVVRLVLRADRDFDYVSLKDQRASCLEPVQQMSGYRFNQGTGYYQSAKDAAMYYFFDHLREGTYVFEYPLYVTHKGQYTNGITTVQCLYAPEFSSNTESVNINVK